MSFLQQVAQTIYDQHSGHLGELCCVFPNRRSGLFFQRQLQQIAKKTSWTPEIRTIGELMQELSAFSLADPLDLLFDIYDIYASKTSKPESLDAFQPWAEMMLADFDTLDKYLLDPHAVFKNIRDLKEIDQTFGDLEPEDIELIRQFWKDFRIEEESEEKTVFLQTWNILPLVYDELQLQLRQKGEGYEGLLYREVAGKDSLELNNSLSSQHYCFIGFNALSKSEKALLSSLQKSGKASFFWDFDPEYLHNENMEAGRFVRENILQFPPHSGFTPQSDLKSEKNIHIYDLPSDVLQAKTVHKILSGRQEEITEATDTAVIACDENLLMPILTAIPGQVEEVNITMGYPFANTPLNAFVDALLNLHRNERRSKSGKASYYHKDVSALLNHQYYKMLSDGSELEILRQILKENRVYVGADFFKKSFDEMLFQSAATIEQLCRKIESILEHIVQAFTGEEEQMQRQLELEYVMLLLGRLNRISEICSGRADLEIVTFIRLFRRILRNLKIPFQGEPLAGLQVMGILETRLLDFKHVIMLSVNEDVMPRPSAGSSFIPYAMRYAFGLPTREDMDAIYAYYFYRVIQRAEKVDLMYKSAAEGVRSGEMSRYLYQMKYDYDAEIIRPVLPMVSNEKSPIVIEKSQSVLDILDKYDAQIGKSEDFLSPSALNTYLDCSLKFYFRKVARIAEQKEVLEELDPIGVGNILHKTIQFLYERIKGADGIVSMEDLQKLKKDPILEITLREEFSREYFKTKSSRAIEGRNLIIFEIIKQYLLQIIAYDIGVTPFTILDLEQDFTSIVDIGDEGSKKIRIGGQIDRVDSIQEGLTRIVDYKSGKASTEYKSLDALFDQEASTRSKEAFQAFMYGILYLDNHPGAIVQPGLYVVRNLRNKDFAPHFIEKQPRQTGIPVLSFNEIAGEFRDKLGELLADIYNPDIAFSQTENIQHCRQCDFKNICQR